MRPDPTPVTSPRRTIRHAAVPAIQRRGELPSSPAGAEDEPADDSHASLDDLGYAVPASLSEAQARHLELVAAVEKITAQLADPDRRHDPRDPSTRMRSREWHEWARRARGARNAKNAEIRWLKAWMKEEGRRLHAEAKSVHRHALGCAPAIAAAVSAAPVAEGIQNAHRTAAYRNRLRVLTVQKVVGFMRNLGFLEDGSVPRLGSWERADYEDAVAAVADILDALGAQLPGQSRVDSETLATELLHLRITVGDLAFDEGDRYQRVCPLCGGDAHGAEGACPASGGE